MLDMVIRLFLFRLLEIWILVLDRMLILIGVVLIVILVLII